jgi:DeoR/GlpR family transcriptional regulator of sugar metabolism
MLSLQRRYKILDMLQEEGSVRVSVLADFFRVSEPTVRQDLKSLEAEGHIIREHGGAYLRSISIQVRALSFQRSENLDKKSRIGKKAAELVKDGDFIIMDGGSTLTEMARNIGDRKNLKIITNGINIPLLLAVEMPREIIVTGGDFNAPTLSLMGELAARTLDGVHVDKCFLAASAVSVEGGITLAGFNLLSLKRTMIGAASETYLLVDSTKIGKTSFASIGPIELVKYIVTDDGIAEADRQALEQRGITVIVGD